MEFKHKSVLLNEVISGLNINPDGFYLDCTLGGAGHSYQIVKKLSEKGMLFGIDKDDDALKAGGEKLEGFNNVKLIKSDFKNLEQKLEGVLFDGILIDLGVSSHQIDTAERGFSFMKEGRLDMRMDKNQDLSAFEVVNEYSKQELEKILYLYGEERNARRIVAAIIKAREIKPIQTTLELNKIIEDCLPAKIKFKGASKKTFQAIRIEVNSELEGLSETLEFLIDKLKPEGRIAVISFHSLEDRIVKQTFKKLNIECTCPPKTPICICGGKKIVDLVTRKPITASQEELEENNRSRSAKLRIAQKI